MPSAQLWRRSGLSRSARSRFPLGLICPRGVKPQGTEPMTDASDRVPNPWRRAVLTDWEGLVAKNDVELYVLIGDPEEIDNLAMDKLAHGDLVMAMNAKLNARI